MVWNWFLAALLILAALLALFLVFTSGNDQSYRKYQRAARPSDFTTAVGPMFAAWECPTLNVATNTLTEPCK